MAEEEAFQFKSKDPELQKWLMAVLAKQQLENKRHISQAHQQMRHFLEMKFSVITKAKGSNEPLEQPPFPNQFGGSTLMGINAEKPDKGPRQLTLTRPLQPKQPKNDNDDIAPPCEASEADAPAKESMHEPDSRSRTPPTSGLAAKLGVGAHFNGLGTSSCAFEGPESLVDKLMREPLDMVAALMILASTISFFLQLQWKGYEARVTLDLEMPGGWPNAEIIFSSLEFSFAAVFLLELALRLSYFKRDFFRDRMNTLDAFVVVITSLDTFLLSHVGGMDGDFTFVRLVRYAKLVRALRFIRVMKLCQPLRVLIRTIASSLASLFWSMVIVAAYMLMSSLFVCQTLQEFMRDDTRLRDDRMWVEGNYGSASKALWTMFEITFSGGWPTWVTPLVEKVSVFYAFYFAVYVGGVVFAVIRIITALFLKDTLAVAATDQEMMLRRKAQERAGFAAKLLELYRMADTTGDDMIDWQEFRVLANNPEAKALFASIEFEPHEMESLFKLLDDGDGQVSFEEFLSGILRMTGTARSQDVLALLHDNRKILHQLSLIGLRVGAIPSACSSQDLGSTRSQAWASEDELNILSAL